MSVMIIFSVLLRSIMVDVFVRNIPSNRSKENSGLVLSQRNAPRIRWVLLIARKRHSTDGARMRMVMRFLSQRRPERRG